MLVLTRKPTESIRIGEGIEVIVLRVARNRVRLGLRCSPEVSIIRGELVTPEGGSLTADREHVDQPLASVS